MLKRDCWYILGFCMVKKYEVLYAAMRFLRLDNLFVYLAAPATIDENIITLFYNYNYHH